MGSSNMQNTRLIIKYSILFIICIFISKSVGAKESEWNFTQIPHRIIVQKTGIDLPIKSAPIQENTWDVYLDAASFGEGSSIPGVGGNTIIFSHDIPRLFYSLHSLVVGDEIHLTTDTDLLAYSVKEIHVVSPEDIHYLDQKYHNQLTLFTCTGQAYSKRLVIVAQLIPALLEN